MERRNCKTFLESSRNCRDRDRTAAVRAPTRIFCRAWTRLLFEPLGRRYPGRDTCLSARAAAFRRQDAEHNFTRHIGLIHLMLPNARIIDIRREPMACCVSNLKQLFARGQSSATESRRSQDITGRIWS